MPARTGERADETGTFHCRGCEQSVRVRKGQRIPECPCGGTSFVSRTHEAGTRRGKRTKGDMKAKARATAGAGRSRTGARRRAA